MDTDLQAGGSALLITGFAPIVTVLGFVRASNASYFDANQTMQIAPPNTLRGDTYDPVSGRSLGTLIETTSVNSIRNPRGEGAVVGTTTMPTNWSVSTPAGLTRQVVGVGYEDGIPYVDVRQSGTTNATLNHIIFDTGTGIPATIGQQWMGSCYVRLISGSIAPATSCSLLIYYDNSAGTAITTGGSTADACPMPTNAPLRTQRYLVNFTANNALTAFVNLGIRIQNITSGAPYDFTFRIGAPQLEQIVGAALNVCCPVGGGWTVQQAVPTSYQPDFIGGSRAVYVTDTSVLGLHNYLCNLNGALPANQICTHSIYVKDGGRRFVRMNIYDNSVTGNQLTATFDLVNGTITQQSANLAGVLSSVGITPLANGWYRIWVTGTLQAGVGTFAAFRMQLCNNGTTSSYVGDGTTGIYFCRAQQQLGQLTDYINNEPSSVILPNAGTPATSTRATDQPAFGLITTGGSSVSTTGYAPALTIDAFYQPATGTISFVGNLPTFRVRFIALPATVTETGSALTVVPGDFVRPSQASYYDQSLTLRQVPNDVPRYHAFDPVLGTEIGYLLEPASQNWVRNVRLEGGTTGSTTLPTNVIITNTGTSTYTLVGQGVEDGIPYCDIRCSGATNGNFGIQFEASTGIPMTPGQQWIVSLYVRLIAGTIPNPTTNLLAVYAYNSAGLSATINGGAALNFGYPTNAPLRTQRMSASAVISAADRAFVAPRYGLGGMTSGPVDYTLRYGIPQAELANGVNVAYSIMNGWAINTGITQQWYQPDPWGTSRAVLFQDTPIFVGHSTNNASQTLNPNQQWTFSVFAKDAGRRYMLLTIYDWSASVNFVQSVFDLQTGTVGTITNGGNGFGATAAMIPLANGWYRCAITGTPTTNVGDTLMLLRIWPSPTGGTAGYTGNGTGFYVAGTMLNVGGLIDYVSNETSSDMLPAIGAPAASTRAADQQFITLAPASGQVTVTGYVPAVSSGYVIPTATALITGHTPSLYAFNTVLKASPCKLTITGNSGDLITRFLPATGVLRATGSVPRVTWDIPLTVPTGTLEMDGMLPILTVPVLVTPDDNLIIVAGESRSYYLLAESRSTYVE